MVILDQARTVGQKVGKAEGAHKALNERRAGGATVSLVPVENKRKKEREESQASKGKRRPYSRGEESFEERRVGCGPIGKVILSELAACEIIRGASRVHDDPWREPRIKSFPWCEPRNCKSMARAVCGDNKFTARVVCLHWTVFDLFVNIFYFFSMGGCAR